MALDKDKISDRNSDYDLWIKNAPLKTSHMLVLKDNFNSQIPWYVREGQDLNKELKHFGKRIIVVFDLSLPL